MSPEVEAILAGVGRQAIERLADVHVGELRGAIERMTHLYLAIF